MQPEGAGRTGNCVRHADVVVCQTEKCEHALYDTDVDRAQQLGMMTVLQLRAQRSEPETIGMVMYCRRGTPMYGTDGKANRGAAILGWPDFPLVQVVGEDCYRYYTKDAMGDDFNFEPLSSEIIADMVAKAEQDKEAREAVGDFRPLVVAIEATSDKFKYD